METYSTSFCINSCHGQRGRSERLGKTVSQVHPNQEWTNSMAEQAVNMPEYVVHDISIRCYSWHTSAQACQAGCTHMHNSLHPHCPSTHNSHTPRTCTHMYSSPLDRSTEQRRHSQSTHAVHHGQVTSEWPRWTNEEHVLTQQVLSTRHRRRHYRQTSGMLTLRKLWIHTCTHFMPYLQCAIQVQCFCSKVSFASPDHASTVQQNLAIVYFLVTVHTRQQLTPDNYWLSPIL